MAGRLPAVVIDNGTGYAIRFYLLSNQLQTRNAHLKCKVHQGGRILYFYLHTIFAQYV